MTGRTTTTRRAVGIFILVCIFLRELWNSSIAVARAVLRRDTDSASAIIAIPLSVRTDAGITMLANCITLTPGTTSLHVSEDRSTLYVHILDVQSVEAAVEDIKTVFERRIREIEG